jgi:hypothetical protein
MSSEIKSFHSKGESSRNQETVLASVIMGRGDSLEDATNGQQRSQVMPRKWSLYGMESSRPELWLYIDSMLTENKTFIFIADCSSHDESTPIALEGCPTQCPLHNSEHPQQHLYSDTTLPTFDHGPNTPDTETSRDNAVACSSALNMGWWLLRC